MQWPELEPGSLRQWLLQQGDAANTMEAAGRQRIEDAERLDELEEGNVSHLELEGSGLYGRHTSLSVSSISQAHPPGELEPDFHNSSTRGLLGSYRPALLGMQPLEQQDIGNRMSGVLALPEVTEETHTRRSSTPHRSPSIPATALQRTHTVPPSWGQRGPSLAPTPTQRELRATPRRAPDTQSTPIPPPPLPSPQPGHLSEVYQLAGGATLQNGTVYYPPPNRGSPRYPQQEGLPGGNYRETGRPWRSRSPAWRRGGAPTCGQSW